MFSATSRLSTTAAIFPASTATSFAPATGARAKVRAAADKTSPTSACSATVLTSNTTAPPRLSEAAAATRGAHVRGISSGPHPYPDRRNPTRATRTGTGRRAGGSGGRWLRISSSTPPAAAARVPARVTTAATSTTHTCRRPKGRVGWRWWSASGPPALPRLRLGFALVPNCKSSRELAVRWPPQRVHVVDSAKKRAGRARGAAPRMPRRGGG